VVRRASAGFSLSFDFCQALLIRETRVLLHCPALRLTCGIAGGLRVIAHANDEEQRYDPKKECLHGFPP
jgi:hypothetical protein